MTNTTTNAVPETKAKRNARCGFIHANLELIEAALVGPSHKDWHLTRLVRSLTREFLFTSKDYENDFENPLLDRADWITNQLGIAYGLWSAE